MKHSLKTGFSFGLTSGIITTLGLIVGLHSTTKSKVAVISGVLVIAIADALSDALGIHISEESENKHNKKEIWESTISTFMSKFIFSLTFVIPILLLDFSLAILISVVWGLSVLCIVSLRMAKEQNAKPWKVIFEHITIAVVVIVVTHYVGDWVSVTFRN